MKLMPISLALAVMSIVASTPSAFAAEQPGGYVGISIGQASDSHWCDIDFGACEDTDTGWKIYGGHQFSPNLGVEGGYVDFGELTDAGPVTAEVWGLFISAIGTYPIGDEFGIFGKIGLAYTDVEVTDPLGSVSDNDVNLMIGVGAKFNFDRNFSVRVEWERFPEVGGFEDDFDLLSAGLVYKF
jgi:OOP family OmpA-OmpF porin